MATNFHLPQNLHYPDSSTASGKVFVRFQITKTGAVRDVQIAKGLHPLLDAEAYAWCSYGWPF